MAGVVDLPTIWRLHRKYVPLIAGQSKLTENPTGSDARFATTRIARDVYLATASALARLAGVQPANGHLVKM
jgi:hypothetical protein